MGVITGAVVTAAGTAYAANKASKASQAQTNALRESQEITRDAASEARRDAVNLFDRGLERQAQGFTQSRDLLSGGLQPQANMLNQGNLNAQNTLLSGGQGYMDAILGQGGNPYAGLQAKQVAPDFSYLTDYVAQQNQLAQQPVEQQAQAQLPPQNITPFQAISQAMSQNGRTGLGNLFNFNPFNDYTRNNNGRMF